MRKHFIYFQEHIFFNVRSFSYLKTTSTSVVMLFLELIIILGIYFIVIIINMKFVYFIFVIPRFYLNCSLQLIARIVE